MIIKNARSALVSNYEVQHLLNERIDYQKKIQSAQPTIEYPEHLRTVQFELSEYLKTSPSSTQELGQVTEFLQQLDQYSLTIGEKVQVLNLRPKSAVEIYLLIEECEERFSEDDLDNILNIILTTLPRDDDYGQEEEEEPMQDE